MFDDLEPDTIEEYRMKTLRLFDQALYGCAYQFIFYLLTPTFGEVLGVAAVVPQLSGHLNPYL